jgi:dimethylargininase
MRERQEGSMRVFDFDHAIVRVPGLSVVQGLRDDPSQVPSYDGVMREHAAYVAALGAAGLAVDVLPPLEDFPDSVFVEDPALVLPEGAVLLRPGAPSRMAEREAMRGALVRHFPRVLELGEGALVDGGDVLVAPDTIYIGLSKRTNLAGAEALQRHLADLGRAARVAATPEGVLHFKTASSLLDEETVLATRRMAESGVFEGLRVLVVPEDAAANALRANDTVFVGAAYPRTIEMIAREGHHVVPLDVRETAKLDAGLSCLSLRWKAAA